MSRTVLFVELPAFAGVVPLASGYVEAYARKDPLLTQAFRCQKISLPVKMPFLERLGAGTR